MVADNEQIREIVKKLITDNPDKARQARDKMTLQTWFVGHVMSETKGAFNPVAIAEIVREELANVRD